MKIRLMEYTFRADPNPTPPLSGPSDTRGWVGKGFMVFCPGCGNHHVLRTEAPEGHRPIWTWNGSMEAPTFSPSLLVAPGTAHQCHSFIRDGVWEYLDDCHHSMKGQKVPMVEE
jgi:hypothetical protein